jgi:Mg2+-importing ATPase
MESVISASIIVLVIRTRKHLFSSKPGKHLLLATLFIVGISIILPFTPVAQLFGFRGLSISYLTAVGLIVSIYIATAEIVKKVFYKIVTF